MYDNGMKNECFRYTEGPLNGSKMLEVVFPIVDSLALYRVHLGSDYWLAGEFFTMLKFSSSYI